MEEPQADAVTSQERVTPFEHHPDICSPIRILPHVWTYLKQPPKWIDRIIELIPRGSFVIKNKQQDCHVEANQFIPRLRLDKHSVPRTLVCHDMKGGYLEDKFVSPINVGNGYAFYRWSQIDVFVYFSHHLITIPPLAWINAAHANGVQILGTFITEWDAGQEVCQQLFSNSQTLDMFINVLVDISVLLKLDGWLLNIENPLEDVPAMVRFVSQLTKKMHARRPNSLVIWYDSVINDGKLKWQNELNEFNRCFFDVCDGIFINYTWNEDNLKNTVKAAEHRFMDVYVGVDVFGRNFFAGGNFNTYLAAEKIRQYNLSMAIFAPGWTHETLLQEPANTLLERFLDRDNAFWRSLWPYLYTHTINIPFQTFFYIGVDKDWFKLHSQEVQLSRFLHAKESLPEDTQVPALVGMCNCLQLELHDGYTSCLITNKILDPKTEYVHHLIMCDLYVPRTIIFYYYCKNTLLHSRNDYLTFVLLVKRSNGDYKKVVCHATPQDHLKDNLSVLELNATQDLDVINMVAYQHKVPPSWVLRCYLLNLNNTRILEVGAKIDRGDSACLCGVGFKDTTILQSRVQY